MIVPIIIAGLGYLGYRHFTKGHSYVAAQGDTVVLIAKRFGTTTKAVMTANGGPIVVVAGKKIHLPSGVSDSGPIAMAMGRVS